MNPGRMAGRATVVAGGTGRVGEGLVRSFLLEGAQVAVPIRTAAREERLRGYVEDLDKGRLYCLPAQIGEPESAAEFRDRVLERFGKIDLAVASVGGWYYGYPLHQMPLEEWERLLHDNLTTHFVFMQSMLSILHRQEQGMYVMINGSPAEMVIPDSGATSIVAAAQSMMSRVLAVEAHAESTRVYSLLVFNPVRTRDRGEQVMPDWVTPEQLGEYIIRLFAREAPNLDEPVHRIYTVDDLEPSGGRSHAGSRASRR